MTTSEITSFIQRLMRRELYEGELSTLTTRDLDDINTYLAERAKANHAAQPGSPSKTHAQASVQQRVKAVQQGSQTFKNTQTYSEREILQELGSDPLE